jgi:hypothetical protein
LRISHCGCVFFYSLKLRDGRPIPSVVLLFSKLMMVVMASMMLLLVAMAVPLMVAGSLRPAVLICGYFS